MKPFLLFFISLFTISIQAQIAKKTEEFYSIERFNKAQTSPKYILFKDGSVNSENFLDKIANIPGMDHVSLRFLNTETDPQGNKHYRYVQVLNGIDVLGSMYIAHEQNGIITSCNGEVFETPKSPSLLHSGNEALQKIIAQNKSTTYYSKKNNDDAWLQTITGNQNAAFCPQPYLVILPAQLNEVYHTPKLVYAIDLYAIEPLSRKIYYLDALTLETLFTEDKIETINVPGKANTKYSGLQNIVTDSVQTNSFRLREFSRGTGNGIETYNMLKGTVYNTATDFFDTDNYWTNFNVNMDEVGGDVHWGSEMTYDFFKNVFNRNSIDNNGFKLISYVHYSNNYVNAFWNGYFMTYGDGGNGYLPLTSLDVCGHEITHGLTQKTAALIYSNESGALNESFSDIFGISIDFYTRPTQANFRMGEQFGPGGSALRDMSDPKAYSNPSTYKGQFWVSNKSDNGGVHYNSGVQNKWFYLLCVGDTGTNDNGAKYKVDSIGYIKAAQISFQNLTTFLTPLSDYDDARFYSIVAAKQLFGECSNEAKQVQNAWHAVGVGAPADTAFNADFSSSKNTSCSIPFTVQFYNNSTNAIGYYWEFGDGQTSILPNPSHTYTTFGNFNVSLVANSCNATQKDTLEKLQFVKTNANLPECLLYVMPKKGLGVTLTNCTGNLRDDGDTSDYGNLIYSVRSIAPANAGLLKLTFKEFDFENKYDFLYVYDGPDTLSKLIGKYTGNNLPEGGSIICQSGAVTLRQTSDFLITGKGFEIDWQCVAKTNTDFKLETASNNIFGRKLTSSELKQNQNLDITVRSNGNTIGNSTTLKYKLNNGTVQSKSVTLISGIANTNIGPFDLSAVGTNTVWVWVEDALDGIKENDTLKFNIQQVDNAPVTLPYLENFDAMTDVTLYQKTLGVGGNPRTDYENTSPQCRLRTNAGMEFITGVRSITFDKSDRNWLVDTIPQSNYLTLTYNMSNMVNLPMPLLFRLVYTQHGDKRYPNDAIWVRGCDTCNWIKFFDLFAGKAAAGTLKTIPLYNLNYYLDSAKQVYTSSFQIRIGQQDQNSTINIQQYTGYTFDNIRFSTWNIGINKSEEADGLSISPNPSNGLFVISTTHKFKQIEITDMKGRTIKTSEIPMTPFFEIDLSELPVGVYVARFEDVDGKVVWRKLVRE